MPEEQKSNAYGSQSENQEFYKATNISFKYKGTEMLKKSGNTESETFKK